MYKSYSDEEYKPYLFEYSHNGSRWGFEIVATSPQDALERLKRISLAHYKGEVHATVKVPGGSFISILIQKLMRFFKLYQ